MNKKLLGIAGALVLTAVAGVSCAKAPVCEEPTECPEAQTYVYFGLGNFAKAKQIASVRTNPNSAKNVQTDVYGGAVLFDAEGKVLEAKIDVMQAVVKAPAVNQIESSKATALMNSTGDFKSKWELGAAYNMLPSSAIGKEWYQQMDAYQNWLVGKDVEDVKNAGYKVKDATHVFVPTSTDLLASVSITTEGYLEVVQRAWNNRVKVAVEDAATLKVGLGMVSKITSTTTKWEVGVTVAGGLFAADNKVVAATHDYHQVPLTATLRAETTDVYDVAIKVGSKQLSTGASESNATILSKHDLGPAYAMYYKAVDTATANQATIWFNGKVYEVAVPTRAGEWFEQANDMAAYLVGKTVASVVAQMNTTTNKFNADVISSVTITVDEYLAAYAEAHTVANDPAR